MTLCAGSLKRAKSDHGEHGPKMPPVSEAQRRAMEAAKSGNSTLGIPQSVGAEFAAADPGGKLPARKPDHSKLRRAMMSSTAGAAPTQSGGRY